MMSVYSVDVFNLIYTVFPIFGVFLLGLFVGSFLNVVADRSAREESFWFGRSRCDFCKTILKVKDLTPVFSFLSTLGKCRYCKQKLSLVHPLSEVLTGVMFVLAYFLVVSKSLVVLMPMQVHFSGISETNTLLFWLCFAYFLIVFSFYIVIFLADAKYQLIPNKVVIPAIIFVFIGMTLFTLPVGLLGVWAANMISATILAGFFWFLYLVTKGKGMGFGDVKLAFLIGLFNGFPNNIPAIFGAFVLGSVYGVFLVLLGKKGMKDKIAFGPFMVLASVLALVFGNMFFGWYLGL